MNNFEKATIEYIYEMLPREDCTPKEFRKAMGAIHNATKEWSKFYIPRGSKSVEHVGEDTVCDCKHSRYYVEIMPVVVCTDCGELLGKQTEC